jgi:hypothetical protein
MAVQSTLRIRVRVHHPQFEGECPDWTQSLCKTAEDVRTRSDHRGSSCEIRAGDNINMPRPPKPLLRASQRPERLRPAAAGSPAGSPLSDVERDELESLLDAEPEPLEPLDVSMLDGFFCALLVQPQAVAEEHWLVRITDVDGRALPPGFDASRLHSLARRRHAELNDSIEHRRWFDPWVFELQADVPELNYDDEDDSGFEPERCCLSLGGWVRSCDGDFPGLDGA